MNKCYYPDFEGGFEVGVHAFGDDGFCNICGERLPDDYCRKCHWQIKKVLDEQSCWCGVSIGFNSSR